MSFYETIAVGSVTGSATPTFRKNRGFSNTIARASAGNVTLTMDYGGIDATECISSLTLEATIPAAGGAISLVHTSDTAKQILTVVNAALADADFSIELKRVL